jgi:hypothetical protein
MIIYEMPSDAYIEWLNLYVLGSVDIVAKLLNHKLCDLGK